MPREAPRLHRTVHPVLVLALVALLIVAAAPAAADHDDDPLDPLPVDPGDHASVHTDETQREECTSTRNGTTCTTTHESSTTATVEDLTITVVDRESHAEGHHENTSQNHWTEDRDTLLVGVQVGGPVTVSAQAHAGTRSTTHEETTNGSPPRSSSEDAVVTGASANTPVTRTGDDASVAYREEHSGDAIHRCIVEVNEDDTVQVPCPRPLLEGIVGEQVPEPAAQLIP